MTLTATNPFTFVPPGRIFFGPGCFSHLPHHAAALGSRALLVRSPRNHHAAAAAAALANVRLLAAEFFLSSEPSVQDILDAIASARAAHVDCIVAVGGGSVIDAAKAIAAMLTNPGDLFDYLETIGRALPLPNPPLPSLAVPTTAGTGAEVTFNAVISSPAHHLKVSLRHPTLP
ncbi:MAG: iron-containing alcohol dehydrogenase, partial [bacterium]|nr:iron-containing alcohol dehydrogenase [bacterium]